VVLLLAGWWPRRLCMAMAPDLQTILRQSCDYLTIMPKLRSTYDGGLTYKTSYRERRAVLGHSSSEMVFLN